MWLLVQNVILAKDNLTKRNWKGNEPCVFCTEEETTSHVLWMYSGQNTFGVCLLTLLELTVDQTVLINNWFGLRLPHGKQVSTVGLAAICFALWRTRNSVLKAREPNAQQKSCLWFALFLTIVRSTAQRVRLPDRARCVGREEDGIVLPPATVGGRGPKIPVTEPLEASLLLLTHAVSLRAEC